MKRKATGGQRKADSTVITCEKVKPVKKQTKKGVKDNVDTRNS